MSNHWLRLWHDMPTDPKWRTISRVSKQPISLVIAVYVHLMVSASRNVTRGHADVTTEDIASALDVTDEEIAAVLEAMQGRVLNGENLSGWEARQPKREDVGDDKTGAKSAAERQRDRRARAKASEQVTTSHETNSDVTTSHEASRNVTTDKDKDTEKNISTTTVVDKSEQSDVAKVFNHWKSVMNSPNSNLDKKRKAAIEARLKDGFSVEDLNSAIEGCRKTPHNMGDNDRGQKFNDIELICRNAPNVERFMNATGVSPPKPKTDRPMTAADKYVAQRDAMRANNERTITGSATRIA